MREREECLSGLVDGHGNVVTLVSTAPGAMPR
jgi:hypothetical protein